MIKFIKAVLSSAEGIPSSKRFIGVLGGLSLIIFMFIFQSDLSVECVLILTLGALGISGAENIFKKDKIE